MIFKNAWESCNTSETKMISFQRSRTTYAWIQCFIKASF